MKRILFFPAIMIVTAVCLAMPAQAQTDTPETRGAAAARYLQIVPMKDMMRDMAVEIAKKLPEQDRAGFIDLITKHVNVGLLEESSKAAMVRHFTTGEIEAMARFYATPEGRSVMKKFGGYMSDLMPVLQLEMGRAMEAYQQEKQGQQQGGAAQ